jgi:hypothetical protein
MFSRKFCNFGFAAHLFQEDNRKIEGKRGPPNTQGSAGGPPSILDSVGGPPSILDSAKGAHIVLNSAGGHGLPLSYELPEIPEVSWQSSKANAFILHLLTPASSQSTQLDRIYLREQIRELGILEEINIRYYIGGVH